VLLDVRMLKLWPAVSSKTSIPMVDVEARVTVWLPPRDTRFVYPTLVVGVGGTNRSPLLVTVPAGVDNIRCPDVVPRGKLADKLVDVAEVTLPGVVLTCNRSFAGVVSKFVPLMEMGLGYPKMVGVKLDIVGCPAPAVVTTKLELLVALPLDVVTLMVPDVAPVGTDTIGDVGVAVVTVALVPLNFTVLSEGVELNEVP
jgi:hypothetical protein